MRRLGRGIVALLALAIALRGCAVAVTGRVVGDALVSPSAAWRASAELVEHPRFFGGRSAVLTLTVEDVAGHTVWRDPHAPPADVDWAEGGAIAWTEDSASVAFVVDADGRRVELRRATPLADHSAE